MKYISIALVAAAALLSGCQDHKTNGDGRIFGSSEVNQFQLCEVDSFQQATSVCKEGQLVSVLPNRWGSE